MPENLRHRPPRRPSPVGLIACAALAAGCAAVQVRYPDGRTQMQSRAEFEAYVERVFRYHNRIVNDLILTSSLADERDPAEDPALVRAEREMARACHPLNETVSAHLEGRPPGLFQRLGLPSTVPACEAASRRMEALLPSI